tara:strand:- start:42457 stop:45069 length:2613 start_codon:yes stop_codon:yes gene_type:complete
MAEPRFLAEYKDIYSGFLGRARSLIVDGYWHLKANRSLFKQKIEDFGHIQSATDGVLEALEILLDAAEGERDKPGVQPMINEVLSIVNIHLERITKYYPKNEPQGFKTKDDQREEGKFQQLVFKGEQKLKAKLKNLNVSNDMDGFAIRFFDGRIATLPMKQVLNDLVPEIAAKIESLDIDWDLIMDNGLFINMEKRDIPDYNSSKHFWDQEPAALQFWVSEWNKINKGIIIDSYEMSPWMYFHLNYFKTPIKNQGNRIINPPLRDNEWYVDEIKKYAVKRARELEPAGILIYGTRRFAKSTAEASHCHHGLLIYPTESGTITASNGEDLASITDKMNKSMDYIHPAFSVNILSGKSWDKETDIGLKSSSGAKTYLLFKFFVINTDSGSKRGSQKTAGGNPIIFVADEIGKEEFLKSYRAGIPSFESDNGWVCQPLYVGTGGDEDLSADAERALADPAGNDFIEMDWDILEHGIPKHLITWKRRKFGWFIPAQMSTKTGFKKIKTNFADFLGIKSAQLSKIEFYQTDWEHNNNVVKERRKSLSGAALQTEIVFRPIDPEECFMSAKQNPYPATGIKRHKEKLQSEGSPIYGTARRIGLERDRDDFTKVKMFLDTVREPNEYPHNGSFTDCPFLLYGDFPDERPTDPYRFVAGLDDYKQDESNESKKGSIGAFYIFDRLTRKIILGLANRPDPHTDFHKQMHMALDAFNAKCFMENEDMDFKKYLDRVTEPSLYLYKGFDAYDDFSKFQNGTRKFGWRPDKNTVPLVRGYAVDYTKDDVDYKDADGNVTHTIAGYERIEDIQLAEEMVKFKPDGNFDRLVAFGSCLAIDYYLTCKYITPQSNTQKTEEERNQQFKPARNKFFTKTQRSPFSR